MNRTLKILVFLLVGPALSRVSLAEDPGDIRALVVFDDGSGPALYAGGVFTTAGGIAANNVAKWDGSTWSAVGGGTNEGVYSLTVFDDGSGPALYAGGGFTLAGGVAANYIAKWDGSEWFALGSGLEGQFHSVRALTVFNDGSGPALYAGGEFTTAGGVQASGIAKWDGTQWSPVGGGVQRFIIAPIVWALTVFDDGTGPALYAGGGFTSAGGVAARNIAKWNGGQWSSLSGGTNTASDIVLALTVFDDGAGSALYAAGYLAGAGGLAAKGIAKWDGTGWSALGSGIGGIPLSGLPTVSTLIVFDDGGGPALYAGGSFISADGVPTNNIAKWSGADWSAVSSGITGTGASESPSLSALAAFDDGSGPALYAGGRFTTAGGVPISRIAKWDGTTWSAVGIPINSVVHALAVFDDGSGPALFAGGYFAIAGGIPAHYIAKWDGTSWSPVGDGMDSAVYALTVFDDGSGVPALYAAGSFSTAGGTSANRIAKWDGTSWSPVGDGMDSTVYALTVFDDGSGPTLCAGGEFTSAGGLAANRIAQWDGKQWSALGGGMNNNVYVMTVFDDGSGSALFAGGYFTTAGDAQANFIAKWNASAGWSALGSGALDFIFAMTGFDDGTSPGLYVGGNFISIGGFGHARIAKWNGANWSELSIDIGTNRTVSVLTVFDDGSGPALYPSGRFTYPVNRIAKLEGSRLVAVGTGMNDSIAAQAVFNDSNGPALYAAGLFSVAGGVPANLIAKWDGISWSALGSGIQ